MLITCPVYNKNIQYIQGWVDVATAVIHDHDILLLDNSTEEEKLLYTNPDVLEIIYSKIDGFHAYGRITCAMREIRKIFLSRDYEYWINIEIDVRPAPGVVDKMIEMADQMSIDVILNTYPENVLSENLIFDGVGCALFSRNFIEAFVFGDQGSTNPPDTELVRWLFDQKNAGVYKFARLSGVFDVKHIKTNNNL